MMKFVVKNVTRSKGRVGNILDLNKRPDVVLPTPLCLLNTRKGCVPHLTYDVLHKMVLNRQHSLPLCLPLTTLANSRTAIKAYGKGIASFIGFEDQVIYLSIQDPAEAIPQGYNDKAGISLWPKTGRWQLDVQHFMEMVESFQPDMAQVLCDSDTNKDSTPKRIRKSLDRSLHYLDLCLVHHAKSENVRERTALFATVEGGYDKASRKHSAKQTALRPVDGFVIEGFHNNGPEAENINPDDIKELVSEVVEHLPADKPRVLPGVYRPDVVLAAVQQGIDIFDTSYPYVVTERGGALVFKYSFRGAENSASSRGGDGEGSKTFEWNMKDTRYAADFTPIVEGCECYTCLKHTRAYVNHLLMTGEMLAEVLLMIHNLHHYLQFFSAIRDALTSDMLDQLKDVVLNSS